MGDIHRGNYILDITADGTAEKARWASAPPPTLSDSPILPVHQFLALATVAARYSWNRVLTLTIIA